MEKRVFLILGLIVAVVILVLYGIVRLDFSAQNQLEQATPEETQVTPQEVVVVPEGPQASPEIAEPSEGKEEKQVSNLYRNYEYGFEVSYPIDWTRNEGPFEFAFVFGPAGAPIDDQVQIWVRSQSILDALYKDKTEVCTEIVYSEGIAYRCEGETEKGSFSYAEVERNGQFYFLSVEGDATDERFQSFDEMLSGFTILERIPQ